ncbi:MAG TPA: UbiA family prenyltransferase [Polyangiales bacterium]|nr:UbiA family prenyltransferase [Polyangiales bacterium]
MKIRSYLRLMRIPNVFTSFANVAAGVFLARGGQIAARDILVIAASGCLYCAGMVWNDYCDRELDAQERPDRPIPAGEVSPTSAAALGGVLFALGLALCAAHGFAPLIVSVLLCAAILLYDGSLKNTWAGPLAMGSCRTLNVILGLSVVAPGPVWYSALPLPTLLGIFTLLITQLSRFEVGGTEAPRLRATLASFVALSILGTIVVFGGAALREVGALSWLMAGGLVAYVIWRGRNLLHPLWRAATGPSLGRAIGGGILLMPAIDASFVAASGAPLAAAAVFSFTAPAWLLKRWYYLT